MIETLTSLPQQVLSHQEQSASVDLRNSAQISLRTDEGDVVEISSNSHQAFGASSSQTSFEEGAFVQEFSAASFAAAQFSISVEGELSEDELAAIEDLTGRITPIIEGFFGGSEFNIEEAAASLAGSLGEIEELEINLEKSVVETFSSSNFFNQVGGEAVASDNPVPVETGAAPESGIRDIQALVFSVLQSVSESVAQAQVQSGSSAEEAETFVKSLVEFLEERLQEFLNPLLHATEEANSESESESEIIENAEVEAQEVTVAQEQTDTEPPQVEEIV